MASGYSPESWDSDSESKDYKPILFKCDEVKHTTVPIPTAAGAGPVHPIKTEVKSHVSFDDRRHFELSPEDEVARRNMQKHMKDYEGEPVAPNEEFEINWAVAEAELKGIIDNGLVPNISMASTGMDNESYSNFKMCADTLQNLLYEGEFFQALANLKGFRRLFSESPDNVLRHGFQGPPLEVLKNIYFGGNGVLPQDRMNLADPYHYIKIGKVGDDDED